ncbi:MAG: DUF2442 domain-containing protein [Anaerolineales bacterium]|nr:DUF2442 domain-containing protein [Anaerolineales bacterium]
MPVIAADRAAEVGVNVNPYVRAVVALDDYWLLVVFENGEQRVFDVKPYLGRGIFARLQDRKVFDAAKVVAGSVEWPGELDLSYDTLYLGSVVLAESPAPIRVVAERSASYGASTDKPNASM